MKILGVIPARFASSRLVGKPLLKIGEKPMVVHVYQNANQSKYIAHLVVATDHEEIYRTCQQWNCNVIMTSENHHSGTDRIIEVFQKMPQYDLILNIQGDEPFISAEAIDELIRVFFYKHDAEIATLVHKIETSEELWADSVVKCVKDIHGRALYFSRSAVPHLRNEKDPQTWHLKHTFWKHIGIYGYTNKALQAIQSLQPSQLEECEKLEQLRWLENGLRIYVGETNYQSFSVDTHEDYLKALALWEKNKHA